MVLIYLELCQIIWEVLPPVNKQVPEIPLISSSRNFFCGLNKFTGFYQQKDLNPYKYGGRFKVNLQIIVFIPRVPVACDTTVCRSQSGPPPV